MHIKTDTSTTLPTIPSINCVAIDTLNTLPIDLIDPTGKVNIHDFLALQNHLIMPAVDKCFVTNRYQYFHVDGGANVHATNRKEDFMIYYPHKCTLDLAAGTKTSTECFGLILICLSPDLPPTPLAPVFYCPQASYATLSPPALRLLNKCHSVLLDSLVFLTITSQTGHTVMFKTTIQNNLDFVKIPIQRFSKMISNTPTLATMMTSGLNA